MSKQRSRKKITQLKKALPYFMIKRFSEGSFILILTAALFMLLSLCSYHFNDPAWSHASQGTHVLNSAGQLGAYLADLLYLAFGYIAYLFPLGFVWLYWTIVRDFLTVKSLDKLMLVLRTLGFVLMFAGGCGLLSITSGFDPVSPIHPAGGFFGQMVGGGWESMLGFQGAQLFLLAMSLIGVTWLTGLSWLRAIEGIGYYTLLLFKQGAMVFTKVFDWIRTKSKGLILQILQKKNRQPQKNSIESLPVEVKKTQKLPVLIPAAEGPQAPKAEPTKVPRPPREASAPLLPQLNLLDKGQPGKPLGGYSHQELEQLSRDVEQHLLDFGIQADVVAVHPGPVVTRFELQLAAGVKVSKLTALAKDLARSLSVTSVRVVEVIPGKTVVGVELPNHSRQMVRFSDVLSADVYQQALSPLTLALGVDIAGHPMVVDLAKMPHLLVAGTTGSGKSVGINAMILSILFKASPEQVRLIMIDPKMLELSVYQGIPHLLTPVVTDMKEAASALRWCVEEMERRYKLMAALGVRNLAGYNSKLQQAQAQGDPLVNPLWKPTDSVDESPPLLQELPYVVVIIDELADMMMVVGKKVEQLIARIAQKARAAGIHMILATQRPSVDVLTGLIKSNIPTRMSFQVSSKIDSRTILDQQGAEQLLGNGDLLFLAPGSGAPLRVHGAYIDDQEVHRIADDWRARGEPDYIDEILRLPAEGSESESADGEGRGRNEEEDDPLYDQAVEFVLQTRKASISSVQRRLKIGYNRAARMIETMEQAGLVGPLDGGSRDVLVPAEER